jgi:hypothetical protein
MIRALAGLLLPWVATWLVFRAARLRTAGESRLMTAVLAFAVGVGWSSVTTLLFVTHGVTIGPRFALADAGLWITVGGVAWWLGRRGVEAAAPRASHRLTTADKLVRAAFAVIAAIAVAALVVEYIRSPDGQWDAWAIWNQKARFLFRGGEDWRAMLEVTWSNPGHPMLVSTAVARLWAYAGAELKIIPTVLAGLFGAAIVAGVIAALDTDRHRAWLAGAFVIAPGTFIHQVAAQTADLPIALYVLLALVMLRNVMGRTGRAAAPLLLGGALVSLSAWTKNEGLVLFAITTLVVGWDSFRRRDFPRVAWWLLGAAPVVLTVAWYKTVVAPVAPEYMSGSRTLSQLAARVFAPAAHALIGGLIGPFWVEWGGRFATGVLPVVMVVAVAAACARTGRAVRGMVAALALMLVGYYVVWLMSPLDTAWLVSTTFDRLMIQLWPAFVVAAFSIGSTDLGEASPIDA